MENYHSKPVITLALDIATKTGWAMKTPENLYSGVEDFSLKPGDGAGVRYFRFGQWLQRMYLERMQLSSGVFPTIRVIYEKPIRFPGRNTDVQAGLVGVMLQWCEQNGITIYEAVPPSVIKEHATGNGNASKQQMVASAVLMWPTQFPKEAKQEKVNFKKFSDQADALWLLNRAMNN